MRLGGENISTETSYGEKDKQLVKLVSQHSNLRQKDVEILLEVSHTLPFIGNLECGDTYINILNRDRKSMVIAQFRHPDCDLYGRDIVGDLEERQDEPAVYRALEQGLSCRGLVGNIDQGRVLVRHSVTPIYNEEGQVIASLTYEHPSDHEQDTEPMKIKDFKDGATVFQYGQIGGVVTEYINDGILIFDLNGVCIFVNSRADELLKKTGYLKEKILGQSYLNLNLTGTPLREVAHTSGKKYGQIESEDVVLLETVSPLYENNKRTGALVLLNDITELHNVESKLNYTTACMREIHHRTKNDLQTIISLLGLEILRADNQTAKAILKMSISRIRSIGIIHELSCYNGVEDINVRELMAKLVSKVSDDMSALEKTVCVEIIGDNITVPSTMGSTIALVVNELVQNSLKHAFDNRSKGHLKISIEKADRYSWITVSDDGTGLEEKEDNSKGLGLKLVKSLVKEKLKGEYCIDSNANGTCIEFSFLNPEI